MSLLCPSVTGAGVLCGQQISSQHPASPLAAGNPIHGEIKDRLSAVARTCLNRLSSGVTQGALPSTGCRSDGANDDDFEPAKVLMEIFHGRNG